MSYSIMNNASDPIQYHLNHPYYYLYYGGPNFTCQELSTFVNNYVAKGINEYSKLYDEVEDGIKDIIKNALAVRDGFYYQGKPKRVVIQHYDNPYRETIINALYPNFTLTINLSPVSDEGDHYVCVECRFPGIEDAYGVVLRPGEQ